MELSGSMYGAVGILGTVVTRRPSRVPEISLTNWKTGRYRRKISLHAVSRFYVTYILGQVYDERA